MMDVQHCSGCRADFYNAGNNDIGVKQCWMLKDAELITRFEISIHSPMGVRRNYRKVQKPQCYHATGFVFLKDIPNYAT